MAIRVAVAPTTDGSNAAQAGAVGPPDLVRLECHPATGAATVGLLVAPGGVLKLDPLDALLTAAADLQC